MILIVCILLILWLLMSYIEIQRSLQWWYRRQSIQQYQLAEFIRDGLLQEAFTLRRFLELSLIDPVPTIGEVNQGFLTTFERFHHDLKDVSDRLSSPYMDDSLPLAIQQLLSVWQKNEPSIHLEVDLPQEWHSEPQEHSQLLLMTLNELLHISLPTSPISASITLCLTAQKRWNELTVHIQLLNPMTTFSNIQDLNHLKQVFCFLMPGQCYFKCNHGIIKYYFRWKP